MARHFLALIILLIVISATALATPLPPPPQAPGTSMNIAKRFLWPFPGARDLQVHQSTKSCNDGATVVVPVLKPDCYHIGGRGIRNTAGQAGRADFQMPVVMWSGTDCRGSSVMILLSVGECYPTEGGFGSFSVGIYPADWQ